MKALNGMNLDSESNLFFRLIISFSFLLIIWFPTYTLLFIIPITLGMIDKGNGNKRIETLTMLLSVCAIYYIITNDLDVAQRFGVTIACLYIHFFDKVKIDFKKNIYTK